MKHVAITALLIALAGAAPAAARDIPGLVSARLLPGWVADGQRFSALELVLEPGWKTYWRSPGDGGIPPRFEWLGGVVAGDGPGADRAGAMDGPDADGVTFYWPRPEVFDTAGLRSVGYDGRMLLPFSIADPTAGADAGPLAAQVSFGLCREVCVPALIEVTAPDPVPGVPDPQIRAAMARQPVLATDPAACRIEPAERGLLITARIPRHPAPADMSGDVVVEVADPAIWLSGPEVSRQDGWLNARFEAMTVAGTPFDLAGDMIRITHLWNGGAVEYRGCVVSAGG